MEHHTIDPEHIATTATEGMFEAITVYGHRDPDRILGAGLARLTAAEAAYFENEVHLEHDCFAEAVDRAVLFYEDEAGGSHNLDHLFVNGMSVWDMAEQLP